MTGPLDYSGAFADLQSPAAAFTQGLQGGFTLQQMDAERLKQQQQQAQQEQMRTDLAALSANPTPQAIGQMSIKYPQLSEGFKRSFDMLSPSQQQSKLESAVPVHAAVLAGEYGVASKQLREHATALENSGNLPEAQQTRAMADLIDQHPETATTTTGMLLASAMGPEKYAAAFGDIGKEGRAANEAAADADKKTADARAAGVDAATKEAEVIGQKAGALAQVKGIKPSQVETMFKSLASQGVISKDRLPVYLADIPKDPTELPAFLNTYKLGGVKPSDQMKYTTPSADATLSAETQRRGQNIQQKQYEQDNLPAPANETMAKQIAFYKAAPLGQFSLNKPWGQSTMDRVMQLNPEYDAAQYAPRAAALKSYAAGGKESLGIDSINIGMNHIDTLRGLALAQKNGDIKQFNRLANAFATQTGNPAPTNLRMATDMVAPEIVKAVTGVGGTGEERAHFGESLTGKGSYSPGQVLGALDQVQDLFAGRLKEKKRSYERSTKLNNFEDDFLSPTAKRLLQEKGAPAKAHPADIDQLLNKYGGSNG